ncbi:hypothetical protein Vafri_8296 [Volvox africanus]|nr:hypothetical protein Vafri_8296 [Volvox africanus]
MNSRSVSICFRPPADMTESYVAHKVCPGSRCPPSASPCDRCRRSCNILFGSWGEHELEFLLKYGSSCMGDISASIHLISKQTPDGLDRCSTTARDSSGCNDNNEDSHVSYHEWILCRPPVKLPPGLPRPPRQPPAFSHCSAVTFKDDLEEDCEEWYNRNVSLGNFPDWLREQQQATSDASPPQPSSSHLGGCRDNNPDDRWSNGNVAAGFFASWLASVTDEQGTSCGAPQTLEEQFCQQLFRKATEFVTVDSDILEASIGIPAIDNAHTAAVYWPAAADACNSFSCFSTVIPDSSTSKDNSDDDGFCCDTLSSPTGSDCHTATTSDDYSRGSSRSCSSLNLGSLDQGSGGGYSSCDEGEEEETSRDVGMEKDEQLLRPGFEGSSRCYDVRLNASPCERLDTALDVSTPALEGDTGDASMVRLVDCTSWELEIEAQQLRLALPDVDDGYRDLVLWDGLWQCAGWAAAWGCGALEGCSCEEDTETALCALQSPWIKTQLEGLLDDVVAGALFGDGSEDEDEELLLITRNCGGGSSVV